MQSAFLAILAFCTFGVSLGSDYQWVSESSIFITGGTASVGADSNNEISAGYSKEGEIESPETCYYSKNNYITSETQEYPTATLNIPHSKVAEVGVLGYDGLPPNFECQEAYYEGTEFECGDWAQGLYDVNSIVARVCTDGADCHDCDFTNWVDQGHWLAFNCNDAPGNQILLSQTFDNRHLAFCEVDVKGEMQTTTTTTTTTVPTTTTTTPAPTTTTTTTTSTTTTTTTTRNPICAEFAADNDKAVPFASCTSIKIKEGTVGCVSSYDGNLSRKVKDNSCFVSQSSKKGWVEYMLAKTADISKVAIIPKGNGEGLIGADVEVCTNDQYDCQKFGTIEKLGEDWCTVLTGEPMTGNMVRVAIEHSNLVICEIAVFE